MNAQMSGFGGEAELLCSTRALPVLTQLCRELGAPFAAQYVPPAQTEVPAQGPACGGSAIPA